MNKKNQLRIFLGAFSTLSLLTTGSIEAEEKPTVSQTISNYKSFIDSPATNSLKDYLRGEDHSFNELNCDGITTGDVNFRLGPGLQYDIIRTLNEEDSVEVIGACDNDWYMVRIHGTLGFIYGEYLRVLDKDFVKSQLLEYRPIFLYAVEAVHGANIREVPDVKTGKILGGLNIGDQVPAYLKLDNGWYQVDFNGQKGYVFGELVKEKYATSIDDYPMFYVKEEAPFLENPYEQASSTISADQYMYLLGENEDYFYTQYQAIFGYVMKSHCERLTDTYVVVDISDEIMKIYHRGEEIFSSYVVTGKDSTPTYEGAFYLRSKDRNVTLVGADYATPVEYWMPFDEGRGLHDASWREYFGGDIYHWGGTHGCVNMPADITPYVYDTLHVGDRVFVKE